MSKAENAFAIFHKHVGSEEGVGEWFSYWENVVRRARRFKVVLDVDELLGNSDEADLTNALLGPYVVRSNGQNRPARSLEFVDLRNTIEIDVNGVPEYTYWLTESQTR